MAKDEKNKPFTYIPQKVTSGGVSFVSEKWDDNAPVERIFMKSRFVYDRLNKQPSEEISLLTKLQVSFEVLEG